MKRRIKIGDPVVLNAKTCTRNQLHLSTRGTVENIMSGGMFLVNIGPGAFWLTRDQIDLDISTINSNKLKNKLGI